MTQGKTHEPTEANREVVKALSGRGITQDDIALYLNISSPTLRKHYADELRVGAVASNVKVINSLYKNAVEGNVAAQIFWAKARLGWNEKVEIVPPTPEPDAGIDLSKLTVDERKELLALMTKAELTPQEK